MTGSAQDPQAGNAREAGEPENDSGHRPDHEAVGVGVIHGAQLDAAHPDVAHPDEAHPGEAGSPAGAGTEPTSAGGSGEGLDDDQERHLPAMSGDDAATLETVSSVVAQTRQDSGTEPLERIAELLRERLHQAGVDVTDADVEELARQVSTGDSADADAG